MAESKRLNRRSFLTRIGGGLAIGGALSLVTGGAAYALTDSDSGAGSDPGGSGRGTGRTDNDPTDPPCGGRRPGNSGITDSDSGPRGDPGGNGRGTGVTDSDSGANSDRACAGRGRQAGRTSTRIRTGWTDRDPSDPAGSGRGSGWRDSDPTDPSGNGRGP